MAMSQFQFAKKPQEISFLKFLYNDSTGEILGRSLISWAKIIVFYIIYYAFLVGFFTVMLLVFFQTLSDREPTWQEDKSLIGTNPGMGFRPQPDEKNIQSTLIWFRAGTENGNWEPWVERLEDFLKDYENTTEDRGRHKQDDCGALAAEPPKKDNICKINKDELIKGNCTKENKFGFRDGRPCILIKLNKIFGWEPIPYEERYLPEDFPKDLEKKIKKNKEDGNEKLNERVWVECHGENPADLEHMGPLVYHPDQGLSKNYYPYENQRGYVSPAVFVEFANPQSGVMIAIECKAWAENIEHDRMERKGSAHFELMID